MFGFNKKPSPISVSDSYNTLLKERDDIRQKIDEEIANNGYEWRWTAFTQELAQKNTYIAMMEEAHPFLLGDDA